jgi:predicted AAA+ superfamily ATPase
MDFISLFTKIVQWNDFSFMVMDILTKVAHFIHVQTTHKALDIAKIFVEEIGDGHSAELQHNL